MLKKCQVRGFLQTTITYISECDDPYESANTGDVSMRQGEDGKQRVDLRNIKD